MTIDTPMSPRLGRLPQSAVVELSPEAWRNPEQGAAERVAVRACEALATRGIPIEHFGAIPVRLDFVRNRMFCLVRANSYLVRLRIKDKKVVAIESKKIANIA